jgi:hypothetical protein
MLPFVNAPNAWVDLILRRLTSEPYPLIIETLGHCYDNSLTDSSPEDIAAHADGLSVKCGELFDSYGPSFRLPYGWDQSLFQSTKSPEIVRESA